jgi:hypothetical protein
MTSPLPRFLYDAGGCRHLSVRESTALSWIEAGLLIAEHPPDATEGILYAFSHEAPTKFCKQSREQMLKRRRPKRWLDFIREYIFAPKHADLLDSRECKRARQAQATHTW